MNIRAHALLIDDVFSKLIMRLLRQSVCFQVKSGTDLVAYEKYDKPKDEEVNIL